MRPPPRWPDPASPTSILAPWNETDERVVARTRVLDVTLARCTSALDPARSVEAVRLACPDWVNVVAVTESSDIIMIEQYRHGVGQVTLEIPGGTVDPGESPEQACARELLEETGHAGDSVRILGACSPNPALQGNRVTTGLVENARLVRARPAGPDPMGGMEELAVRLVPVRELDDLVRSGIVHHALVVAALHLHALDGSRRR